VVAAGGIYNGQTVAAAFALGAEAVWIGTRFIASPEATTTILHQNALIKAGTDDTVRCEVFTGRPARVFKTPYVQSWMTERQTELSDLLRKVSALSAARQPRHILVTFVLTHSRRTHGTQGTIPYAHDMKTALAKGTEWSIADTAGLSFSQSAGAITRVLPAAAIVHELVDDAVQVLQRCSARVVAQSRL
jgi:NAD(P)H-dependent flavin oxidoreductase YrpB (nitropropane dioxygenase family)